MVELPEDARKRYQQYLDRQNMAYREAPYGTWAERWLPFVCKHQAVRCTHGDEIIHRNWRRRVCLICGRALPGDLPAQCWFTGRPHRGAAAK